MKAEELAFVNQQLAGMVRSGIPLESALGQLCQSMRHGDLREELEQLHFSLAAGTPFEEAVAARKLPAFYAQMLRVGARSNDLPGVLTLIADYYRNADTIWTRLKGLMVYPLIVSLCSLGLSIWLAVYSNHIVNASRLIFSDLFGGKELPYLTRFLLRFGFIFMWGPVIAIGIISAIMLILNFSPQLRRRLRWRLPAWRDASLWQLAETLAMLTNGGCPLPEALALARGLEGGSPAALDLHDWQQRLADGHGKFHELAASSRRIPPLFVWIVASSGDDLAAGFKRSAEIFQARATYRTEVLLQAVLPVSVVILGSLIFLQALTMAQMAIANFLPLISCGGGLGS